MVAALLVGLLAGAAFQEPVQVSASLSAGRINVGGTTTLQIAVDTRGSVPEEIRVPQLSHDLEIIGTSDFTQTSISVPGGRTRTTRRDIIIIARAVGVYRIPPVVVRVAGVTYRTAPLDLIVRAGAALSDGDPGTGSSLRIMLEPDTVYVGEQVLLRAEATFIEETRARQSRPATFDPPAPTGFWVQDLPDPISVTLRAREGRTIETQTYRRAYFPLAPGTYHFPPARLHYEVRRGFLYAPETRELVSDSAALIVLPVPAEGRPASYTGAVGRLALNASVSPRTLRTGEATMLTVEVTGVGNVKALPEPRLPYVHGVEVFPPAQDSRVDTNDDFVGGMKRFRYMLVPEQPGVLVIPPIEYAVFDPELRSYVVLRSDELHVNVEPAVAGATSVTSMRPLRATPGRDGLGWVRTPAFAAVQVLPLLLFAGAIVSRRRRSTPRGPQDAVAELRHQLDALRMEGATPRVLAELERILRDAVARIAGAEGEPVAALRAQKRPAAATELENLLAVIHRLRFAPAEPFDAANLIDRADAFITLIAPRRGSSAVMIAVMLGIAAVPGLLVAIQSAPRDLFPTAVEQYEQGNFAGAADSFHAYAQAVPRDATGWYDLGVAARRAGDPGRATWAWLRAVRVAPRDDDARHNLRATGADAALARVQPVDRLSGEERILVASAGWWLLLIGLTVVVLHPGRRRGLVMPGAILLVLAGSAAALEALRPSVVTPLGQGAQLYASPTTRDAALGTLYVGNVVRLVEQRGEWLRVRTDTGQEAWVEREAVAEP